MNATPTESPFSRRAVGWIVGICVVSLLVGIGFAIFGSDLGRQPSHLSDSTSPSAIGHEAFRHLLGELDVPVVVSRSPATRRAARRGVLIVAEPYMVDGVRRRRMNARAMLLVLPKWTGQPHRSRAGWIGDLQLHDAPWVQEVVDTVAEDVKVVRFPGVGTRWRSEGPTPLVHHLQLLRGDGIEPIVACREGVLVGRVTLGDEDCWILSDPDVIATHGLGQGDNALLGVWLVDRLRRDGPVVFDETVHGMVSTPSLWRELFDFPLVLVAMQTLLCVALLIWLDAVRFGAPLPPKPAYKAGKRFLIGNTATLQHQGGHSGYVLVRYLRSAFRTVAERLHLPVGQPTAQLRKTLQRIGQGRGVATDLTALESGVDAEARTREGRKRHIVATARRVHRWRSEMLRGS